MINQRPKSAPLDRIRVRFFLHLPTKDSTYRAKAKHRDIMEEGKAAP
jgi:hypothetical protein